MKAVVLGTGWGQVHAEALRRAGVQPLAIWSLDAAAAQAAAARLGVGLGTSSLEQLEALDPDWVSIATPPATHAALAARFPRAFLLCEKPLMGTAANAADRATFPAERCLVNYAFPFLDLAAAWRAHLPAGPVRLRIRTEHDFERGFTPHQALAELACHPLSLAVQHWGPASALPGSAPAEGRLRLRLADDTAQAELSVHHRPGLHGLRHEVSLGALRLLGGFRHGEPWSFELWRGDERLAVSAGDPDPWMAANHRSINAALRVARGALPWAAGRALGLLGVAEAWSMDALLIPDLGAGGAGG